MSFYSYKKEVDGWLGGQSAIAVAEKGFLKRTYICKAIGAAGFTTALLLKTALLPA